jgi:hypothetical protein
VVEEFYPPTDTEGGEGAEGAQGTAVRSGEASLSQKLGRKVLNSVRVQPVKSTS